MENLIALSRFMSKVDVSDGCWNWTGAKSARGYGRGYDHEVMRTQYAHRLSFRFFWGQEPEEVLHSCDNPSCVKPTHLRSGTHVDNMRDMAKKARGNTAKLSAEDVRSIRLEFIPGHGGNSRELQKRYGISDQTVRQVANRETWKEVR